jgi:glycosyltransferase involved in cell wall biosynthesis
MRLALVTETFPPEVNGVARTLERLASGMLARGHQVEVLRPRHLGAPLPLPGGELVQLPGAPVPGYSELRFGLPARRRLRLRWSDRRPDVVHVATEGPLGWSAAAAARALGVPVTSSFHTNFDEYGRYYGYGPLQRVAFAYLRRFHRDTRRTLAPCAESAARLIAAGFREVGVLGRGVDAGLFDPRRRSADLRREWGAGADDPVLLYVGRLAEEKNVALLARTSQVVTTALPNARTVLVGDGPAATSLRAALPDARFCGMRHGEDLGAHYASGDVFLFPSTTETFGNVVLEAMASGLAVVAFHRAAAAMHVVPGGNGLTVTPGDEDAFVVTAQLPARDPGLRQALGAAARTTALELSWDAVVCRFEEVLLSFAGATSGPSGVVA